MPEIGSNAVSMHDVAKRSILSCTDCGTYYNLVMFRLVYNIPEKKECPKITIPKDPKEPERYICT